MGQGSEKRTSSERRSVLTNLQRTRAKKEADRRDDGRNYSMEGLRLGSLLAQLQAVQAVQGLSELKPKGRNKKNRFTFSDDAKERVSQRQWLLFKADWLEALLEDTLAELEALDLFEKQLESNKGSAETGPKTKPKA
ncbi:MAG: hypothetical protein AABZ47_09240 [Planctomycetota bacterium]